MPRNVNGSPAHRLERLLSGLTVAFSGIFILLFVSIAYHRLHCPFEVDRMESGMLASVWRLRHGYPLYSPPSLEWAPFLYAPLFFYIAAAFTKVLGIQFLALRLVSLLATLGSFGLIFALVHRETRRWRPALFAVGLFAALYPYVQTWYDVGRVDSLALLFFLAALLATRRGTPLLAAALWLLAFLTKQTFLPLGFALFLVDWQRPRRMLTGMAAYALLLVASVAVLQRVTHGWFTYFAFGTAGVIHWSMHTAVMFPFADLLAPLPIACGLILVAAVFTGVRWRDGEASYLAIVTGVLTAAIWYVRAHVGANLNAVIPLYAWMAVLAGVALHRCLEYVQRQPAQIERQPEGAAVLRSVVWLLALLQLAAHLYRPAEIRSGNLAARTAFLSALRATPGDVWVVDHPYDAILAGKPLHADMDALDAVLGRRYQPALDGFHDLVGGGRLTAIVLDRSPDAYEPKGLFTSPPFSEVYRVPALTPGGAVSGEVDQPLYTFLPCLLTSTPRSLTDLRGALVDRSACPTP